MRGANPNHTPLPPRPMIESQINPVNHFRFKKEIMKTALPYYLVDGSHRGLLRLDPHEKGSLILDLWV